MSLVPLHVVTDPDRRGAQVFADVIGRELPAHGVKPRTVALGPGTRPNGLGVEVLGRRRLSTTSLRRLRQELSACDVAVGFGSSTLPALTAASVGLSTPYVYRSIGESAYWANTWARNVRVGMMMRRATGVVALWRAASEDLSSRYGIAPEQIHVIPRGVPAQDFPPRPPRASNQQRARLNLDSDRPVVCIVGSLTEEKHVGLAIEAIARLPEWVLLIAGSGPDRKRLEAQARAVAPSRVHFLGSVSDVVPVLHASDVHLLTSRSEGMPGVIIEAGMCGVPSVATSVGAVPEMIDDGVAGYVVRRDAAAEEIAERLRLTVDRSERMGSAMREAVLKRYEIGVVARRWRAMLKDVTASSPPA